MKIFRTREYIEAYCQTLTNFGLDYKIKHGTYTTSIEHENGKKTFSTTEFHKKTFMAANMVKKDVLKSDFFQEIVHQKFSKQNYDFNRNIRSITGTEVYNIDISKAYATCLLTHGLVTSKTFDYIYQLPKKERLVCVGMLARSYSEYSYVNGELVDVNFHREPTANAFFFLIEEITNVMKECQFYLGKNFIFYWVDGIFFNATTPKHIVRKVEKVLEYYGYPYKYEKIDFFDYIYNDEDSKIVVNMVKNDEYKTYTWGADIHFEEIKSHLQKSVKRKKKKI